MPFGIQPIHIVIIVVVALLVFGPQRLPEMGRSIGKAISEFRRGTKDMTEGFREEYQKPVDSPTTNNASPEKTALPTPVTSVPTPTPSIDPRLAGNFCIHCGAPNPLEALFCNHCGTKLPEKNA